VPLTGDYTVPSYGPWIDDAPNTDIELVLDEISEALEGYEHAEEYDSINIWERFTLSREGRTLRQADIEFDPNLCSPVIDAVNDRLLITSVTASAGQASDSAASDSATNLLGRVIKENELDVRYRTWNRKALRDGDAYIIVWPDQNVPPDAAPELSGDIDVQDVATPLGVNITYGDPRFCRMFYDPENPRRKLFFAQMWMQSDKDRKERIRMNLFYPDRIEKWISNEGTKQKKAADFRRYIDPDQDGDNDYPGSGDDPDGDTAPAASWPMPNPYGRVPVFHLRTDVDFGKPEHRNAWAEQAGLSQSVEILMTTMSFSAYPQRWALQEADSLGNQSVREDPFAEHSPADWDHDYAEEALSTTTVNAGAISNETGSEWEANPGSIQLFKNFRSVGQFATADVSTLIEPINKFANLISTATNTPLWKFAGLGTTMPSGEALKIAEEPLVRKVLDRMALFAGAWQAAYEFALAVLNITARVTVSWANPVTNDLMEVWNLVEKKISLGVPRDVAFMEAGVPEAQAQEWAATYSTVFAEAEYQQGRAKMYAAQADLLTQQAIAAKIANGMPEIVAWVQAGFDEAEVSAWFADKQQENSLSRKIGMFGQITAGLQQLGLAAGMNIISEEGANAIVVELFGDLLPEIPRAMLEADDEDDEPEPGPSGFPALPAGGPLRPEDAGPGLPPGFAQQLPPGTPPMDPIPPQDR
jgi:hypothetical protein